MAIDHCLRSLDFWALAFFERSAASQFIDGARALGQQVPSSDSAAVASAADAAAAVQAPVAARPAAAGIMSYFTGSGAAIETGKPLAANKDGEVPF